MTITTIQIDLRF